MKCLLFAENFNSEYNLHLEVASNFSDFFFLFHFQGLNNRPKLENLLFLGGGGLLELGGPTLDDLGPMPFGLVFATKRMNCAINIRDLIILKIYYKVAIKQRLKYKI